MCSVKDGYIGEHPEMGNTEERLVFDHKNPYRLTDFIR